MFEASKTALVVIDMQRDFIEPGGFGESLGNDVSLLAGIVPTVAALLDLARRSGWFVVHTRESHAPDLSDCPPAKRLRRGAERSYRRHGSDGTYLGARRSRATRLSMHSRRSAGELVIDKPGKGAFYATRLGEELAVRGNTHLVFAGRDDRGVRQTSMREANDRGYDCLLVEDATASYIPAFKQATIEMIGSQGGNCRLDCHARRF